MRIALVNINTEQSMKFFNPMLKRVLQQVARPETKVDLKFVNPGLERATDEHPYSYFLNEREVVEKVIEAERQGYDAAVVGCFLDPGVQKARGIVDIPVIGLCESTIHFACQLGRRFGVVTLNTQSTIDGIEDNIIRYGLKDRVITRSVRGHSMSTFDAFTKGVEDPKIVADDVVKTAKECVEEGANVVVIGCFGLSVFCTSAGVTSVNETVPLVDCLSVAVKTAEMVVDLRKQLGLPFMSRTGAYVLPREKEFSRVRATFGL